MVIKFTNISERLRYKFEDDIEMLQDRYMGRIQANSAIKNYFNKIKQDNETFYNEFMGLMLSDDYKSLYIRDKSYGITSDEKERMFFYEDLDKNNIVSYLELNYKMLSYCIYEMCEFNHLNYFMKRSMLNDCKEKIDVLKKFSGFCIYDYLYYCQIFSLELFKEIFESNLGNGYTCDESVASLTATMEDLFISDTSNYKQIVEELLVNYYILGKNDLFENNHYNLIPFIEERDNVDILNYLAKTEIIFDVLKTYLSFEGDISQLNIDSKDALQTIQKIKRIREI